jgi:hypothetical protein
MFEIDVQEVDESGESFYTKSRIDQYIFDEFHQQQLKFSSSLFQLITSEYSIVAINAQNQDAIKLYFSMIEDKEVSNFIIAHLLHDDPDISELWFNKYDIVTRSASNNVNNLNKIVEETISMFKYRTLEEHCKFLMREINDNATNEDYVNLLLSNLHFSLKRREEFAKLLGVVISY